MALLSLNGSAVATGAWSAGQAEPTCGESWRRRRGLSGTGYSRITLNAEVQSVHQDDRGVKVVYRHTRSGKKSEFSAGYVVICLPLNIVAGIDINPSEEMMTAIEAVPYSSSAVGSARVAGMSGPMMQRTRRQFLSAGGLIAALCAGVWARPSCAWAGQPAAVPAPDGATPGRHALGLERDRDGLYYVPKGYRPGVPMPLMVILHGAGGSSESAVTAFPLADELGFFILATDSKDWTWDAIIKGFGEDVAFLQQAYLHVAGKVAVDRSKLAMTGFSDGASYALSLGIGNGDVFTTIMAFSPGVMQPAEVAGKPRIFLSHGTSDGVMPIDDTSRKFVPRLKALGYDVTYREYEGKHTLPPEIRRDAYLWWLGR